MWSCCLKGDRGRREGGGGRGGRRGRHIQWKFTEIYCNFCLSFGAHSLGFFYVGHHNTCKWGQFYFFLSNLSSFYFLFCCCSVWLARTYSIMWNSSGEWNFYLVLNPGRETLSFTLNNDGSCSLFGNLVFSLDRNICIDLIYPSF